MRWASLRSDGLLQALRTRLVCSILAHPMQSQLAHPASSDALFIPLSHAILTSPLLSMLSPCRWYHMLGDRRVHKTDCRENCHNFRSFSFLQRWECATTKESQSSAVLITASTNALPGWTTPTTASSSHGFHWIAAERGKLASGRPPTLPDLTSSSSSSSKATITGIQRFVGEMLSH